MTLEQLGKEYLKQADELKGVIKGISVERNTAVGYELYDLNRRLTVLREMERDTRILGCHLTEYYSGKLCKKTYYKHSSN